MGCIELQNPTFGEVKKIILEKNVVEIWSCFLTRQDKYRRFTAGSQYEIKQDDNFIGVWYDVVDFLNELSGFLRLGINMGAFVGLGEDVWDLTDVYGGLDNLHGVKMISCTLPTSRTIRIYFLDEANPEKLKEE